MTTARPLSRAAAPAFSSMNLSLNYLLLCLIYSRLSHLPSLDNILIQKYLSSASTSFIFVHLLQDVLSVYWSLQFIPFHRCYHTSRIRHHRWLWHPSWWLYWPFHLSVSVSSFFFQPCSTRQLPYPRQKNHILDLVISSADPSLAPAVSFTQWSPSDHFHVFTKLSINPTPLPPPTLHSFRWFHSIDTGSFLTDLNSSQIIIDPSSKITWTSSDHLQYDSILSAWLTCSNRHQTLQVSNPWFTPTLRAFRSTLRYAENLWKRTHSAANWSSFNKSLRNQYHKPNYRPISNLSHPK